MKIASRTKRVSIIGVAAILLLGGAGAAFAYWTAQGTGTGSATAGESVGFTVTSEAPTGDDLYPGGPSQSVAFTVTNPGPGTQTLTTVTVTVAEADGTAWNDVPGCSAADYTIGTPSITGGALDADAEADGTVTITMNDLGTNQDACQGAVVPLYLVAS